MAKSNGIPILAVLLWHHFCYYKRHKVNLIFTISLPFLLMGMLITSGSIIIDFEKIKPCVPDIEALLAAGALSFATSSACTSEKCLENNENSHSTIKIGYKRDLLRDECQNGTHWKKIDCLKNSTDLSKSNVVYCNVATSNIIYYPKTNKLVKQIMENRLASSLQSHLDFICRSYNTSHTNATFVQNNVNVSMRFIVEQINNLTYDKDTHKQFCSNRVTKRIIGVDNYNDAIKLVRKRIHEMSVSRLYKSNSEIPVPRFWAIVGFTSFDKLTSTSPINKNIEYDIVIDSATSPIISKPSQLSLQSLVEESIILQLTNVSSNSLREPFIRVLPSKCWDRPSDQVYESIGQMLCIVIIVGFILSPMNALDQLVTEKLFHLREYLGTMGVSSAKIRLSWWIFYMMFLIPISIGFSVCIRYTPKSYFGNTSVAVLIFLVILYNTSQLSQAFFLASVMTTTKRTGMMLVFLNFIFLLLSFILFSSLDNLKGTYLYAAYILSVIHPTVPMTIACIYIASWEKFWLGTYFYNMLLSPYIYDEYGGIGITMVFLFVNSMVYMLLAWYIDAVFPGEFGLPRRPWFFVMPSYWIPSLSYPKQTISYSYENAGVNGSQTNTNAFEPNKTGIQIKNLSKIYKNGTVAANNISCQFKRSEITALLGQNGAGKSTLINCIVGILQPTEGSIFIDSQPLSLHTKRHVIGYVPQHDILYPSLTLNEHVNFYGALKNLKFSEAQSLVANDIKNLDLDRVRTVIASQLSGGQKRKLSILAAYLGNPAAIVLDEPTAGIDPFSRRTIWELLLRNHLDTATLLSTHSMQEADMLGDQIAIISSGSLISYGTPSYLKNKYSCGVRLIIAMRSMELKYFNKINDLVQKSELSNIALEKKVGNDVTFFIPLHESRSQMFIHFLKELEAKQEELNFDSYGLSESSMEDVFFIATELHSKEKDILPEMHGDQNCKGDYLNQKKNQKSMLSSVRHPATEINNVASNVQLLTAQINYSETEGTSSYILKITGLFEKRFFVTIRSLHAIIRQLIVPLCFIGLSLIITANQTKNSTSIMPVHLWNQYSTNILFHFTSGAETSKGIVRIIDIFKKSGPSTICLNMRERYKKLSCTKGNAKDLPIGSKNVNKIPCPCDGYCNNAKARSIPYDRTESNDIVFNLNTLTNVTNYPIEDWIVDVNSSRFIVVGGYQFHRIESKLWEKLIENLPINYSKIIQESIRQNIVIIWTKPGMEYAMLNGFNNLQLRSIPNFESYSIQLNLKQIKLNPTTSTFAQNTAEMKNLIYSCGFIIFAVFFSTFSIAIFVMSEKESGMKRFQRIYGVTVLTDWFTNFCADLFFYAISIGMVSFLLYVAPNSFQDTVGEFLFLMVPYGLVVIWHFYMLSFLFETLAGLTKYYIISSLTSTLAAIILIIIIIIDFGLIMNNKQRKYSWTKYIVPITGILPQFYLPESLFFLSSLVIMGQFPGYERIFNNMLQIDALGQFFVIALFSSVAYMGIISIFEYLNIDNASFCSFLCRKISAKITQKNSNLQIPKISYVSELANDVKAEEQKVNSQLPGEDPLEVRMLNKTYPDAVIPSVDGVTFSVPQKQCFGLLGVNGAGKTTIFRILTGFLKPTSGTTMINGSDLYNAKKKAHLSFSYCPQDNMLFDDLSVFQNLKFFAKLRSVPSTARNELINAIMEDLDLLKYEKIKSSDLSGGNKRKLQLAISIIGYPSLIFLDEPTTGMDPGARRKAWRIIESAIERGSSVVLTTHSMEECEALCHRLTILVRGQMMCLGSIQSLKNKFGNRYTMILRLTRDCLADKSHASAENRVVAHDALSTPECATNLLLLKQIVSERCPTAMLIEEQLVMLNYEVSVNDIRLSQLFDLIFEIKVRFPGVIDDFTVSQLSLEQVFANLVQMYELMMPGAAPNVPKSMNIADLDVTKHNRNSNYQNLNPINPQVDLHPASDDVKNVITPNANLPEGEQQVELKTRSKSVS